MRLIIEPDYAKMSKRAANYVAKKIIVAKPTAKKPFVLGLPTGSSPLGMYRELIELNKRGVISFENIITFNMDEYIGLPEGDEHTFGCYLYEHIFKHKSFKSVHYIRGYAECAEKECERYTEILRQFKPDVVCLGIGENGHIAFNDPWVAKFDDNKAVKVVELDHMCRMQQVNDGCFATLEDVPTHAITLTIPTLVSASHLFCVVPATTKANAVRDTVYGEITEDCPASIMRKHPSVVLYCDADSGCFLKDGE
jgi:glucosamine-6-phosphate deaminase